MLIRVTLVCCLFLVAACSGGRNGPDAPNLANQLDSFEYQPGFVDLYWDDSSGKMYLGINGEATELLYQSSLARGVGSNDLGFDRGQLGSRKVVEFRSVGPRLLMIERNLSYRAISDDPDERRAVRDSFAESVIWGFDIAAVRNGRTIVDATEFLLRDSHGIVERLADSEEGTFSPDESRSAIYMERTRAFPDNSEVEARVTFTGKAEGAFLPTVIPDDNAFTVNLHHSFIRLPDDNYEPLPYDARAGIIGLGFGDAGFFDYASEIGDELSVRYARRHRLEKVDPSAEVSDAVEPIVYYVDRGAPEPVRTALIEGGGWWNQAFEEAGYRNAFRVELMPEDADPMDVRYNVIQWVHRSTRGWSYGSSIVDPRTGEILKGHVTLGSLRVRQDYMIAEGLLSPYADTSEGAEALLNMSLARIRQLSAHEIGHTIGMEHNFAASTQGRASVMDYPFPLVEFGPDNKLSLDNAYAVGMGAWDLRTVLYAYQDFPDDVDADAERARIMAETIGSGLKYVSDSDSRSVGTAHPDGNLWDNGADPLDELQRLMRVRERALQQFSPANIRIGRPLATIEETLVPIYLLHRYQLHAAGKLLGGEYFRYALRGDGQRATDPVDGEKQRAALQELVATIDPQVLRLPDSLLDSIPPRPPGYGLTRESFPRSSGPTFDPLGAARSAVSLTLEVLLHPQRAARMVSASARQSDLPGFDEVLSTLTAATWYSVPQRGLEAEIQRATNTELLVHLLLLANHAEADPQVRGLALDSVNGLASWLDARISRESDAGWRAHYGLMADMIRQIRQNPAGLEALAPTEAPPGSPI